MRYRISKTFMLALASLAALIAGATATFAQASSSMAELRGQVTAADPRQLQFRVRFNF